MKERDFQRQVMDYARRCGWKVWHTHDSRREVKRNDGTTAVVGDSDAAGFPDLAMVRRERFVLAELKGDGGKLTDKQIEAIGALDEALPEVYVWEPGDFNEMARILR